LGGCAAPASDEAAALSADSATIASPADGAGGALSHRRAQREGQHQCRARGSKSRDFPAGIVWQRGGCINPLFARLLRAQFRNAAALRENGRAHRFAGAAASVSLARR